MFSLANRLESLSQHAIVRVTQSTKKNFIQTFCLIPLSSLNKYSFENEHVRRHLVLDLRLVGGCVVTVEVNQEDCCSQIMSSKNQE